MSVMMYRVEVSAPNGNHSKSGWYADPSEAARVAWVKAKGMGGRTTPKQALIAWAAGWSAGHNQEWAYTASDCQWSVRCEITNDEALLAAQR